ncbi:MAG: hypothetical protein RIN55_10765 [Tissierellaceae bacterium]|nr:hypothetical protein [Tissierellaceae bacterium]
MLKSKINKKASNENGEIRDIIVPDTKVTDDKSQDMEEIDTSKDYVEVKGTDNINQDTEKLTSIKEEALEGKDIKIFDFSKLRASKSKSESKSYYGEGKITIINSENNGKRITIAREPIEELGNPNSLQIGFLEDSLVIGPKLPENEISYNLRKSGAKSVIYSSDLVKEITEEYNLDYSNGRVSITFGDVEYTKIGQDMVMIVKVN